MTHGRSPSFFRREALARYHGRRGSGDVLRSTPGWVEWGYRVLVTLVALGVAAACSVPIDQSVAGPAVVAGDTEVVAAVPLRARAALEARRRLRVEFGGAPGDAVVHDMALVDARGARRELHRPPAGILGPCSSPLILVRARLLTLPAAGPTAGTATIFVRSQPLVPALISRPRDPGGNHG